MVLKKYENKKDFLNENLEILLKEEAKNEVMIGIVLQHEESKINNWVLGRIENNNEIKIIFLIDDDKEGLIFYLPLGYASDSELEFLVDKIIELNVKLNEVSGTKEYTSRIAEIYSKNTNVESSEATNTHTLKLEKIKQEHILGDNEKLIKLNYEQADLRKITQIAKDIMLDTYGIENCSDEKALEIANAYLKKGLYILTDNNEENVFCHAVVVRKQVNGCAIGAVISPKEHRGKGYAKKCIYSLCNNLLEDGNKFVALHVAVKNHVAKNIYEKVGFEFIEETERITFKY